MPTSLLSLCLAALVLAPAPPAGGGAADALVARGLRCLAGAPQDRDEDRAAALFARAARAGSPAAWYHLGLLHLRGAGRLQDPQRAVACFARGAAAGHPGAQYELGRLYMSGEGVEVHYPTAFAWFAKAAAQGHAGAQFQMGEGLQSGWVPHHGVQGSWSEPVAWYEKSAAGGDVRAQATLGVLRASGIPAPDFRAAAALMRLAARDWEERARDDPFLVSIFLANHGMPWEPPRAAAWLRDYAARCDAAALGGTCPMPPNPTPAPSVAPSDVPTLPEDLESERWYRGAVAPGTPSGP